MSPERDRAGSARESNAAEAVLWRRAARRRRRLLSALVTAQTATAAWYMTKVLPHQGAGWLEAAILLVFAILFSWISIGFWTAIMGFVALLAKSPRFTVGGVPEDEDRTRPIAGRTAVVVPICNEDVARVFAGVEATYLSLERTGELAHFDFYLLSDTTDPETALEEELAWSRCCAAVRGFGRIFYRRRRINLKRKSGNIADFCRRWGSRYDYMIVFDADSVMAGETMVRLAKTMDRRPRAGIIQTVPATVNRESLYARIQQFAGRAYGPMLAAGLHFWQLGESYYWGHNAILRLAPFIRHCALPRLPGRPPLGGEILSHDFVEAALMGKAGWEVWLACDLDGSYEEMPPTLLDELKRDRRWCQGNLQHARLLAARGLRSAHRAIFATGIMAYVSAPLWVLLLTLSTAEVALEALIPPVYFSSAPSLFPVWPQWNPDLAIALLSTTAVLLFLPKLLALALLLGGGRKERFGGAAALASSVVLETVASALFAPVRMWFHGKFVLLTLLGRHIKWGSQRRDDAATGWVEALRHHGVSTAAAVLWAGGVYWLNPQFLWWMSPIVVALIASIPLSVLTSRASSGRAARKWRLFLIPEEIRSPQELRLLRERPAEREGAVDALAPSALARAIVDPCANALHIALLRGRSPNSARSPARGVALREKFAREGIAALSPRERAFLLRDSRSLRALHLRAWRIRNSEPSRPRPAPRAIEQRPATAASFSAGS